MTFNKEKVLDTLMTIGKFVSFISLLMTVVIKTRILLGLKNPSEDWKNKNSDEKDVEDENKPE